MRKVLIALLALVFMLGGCAKNAPDPPVAVDEPAGEPPVYALIVKDVANPYMLRMYDGFADACEALGVRARMEGAGGASGEEQAAIVDRLTDEGIRAIAVAVNDAHALEAALARAMEAGAQVVSMDSAASPNHRMVHIQQADPEAIGRVLIQAAYRMIGGSGEAAILTTTELMPNQVTWVGWMQREWEENEDKYCDMPLVEIVYGLDEYARSYSATRALLARRPGLDIIIAPTSVGLLAASDAVEREGSKVAVTGLGLPSEMEGHIQSGLCPWMYLWNPIDIGYLAAYALSALETGDFTGAAGETFEAGMLGTKLVTTSQDGGTEIVLGNPFKFDAENISIWKDAF